MDEIDLAWSDIKKTFGLDECKDTYAPLPSATQEYLVKQGILEGVLDYLLAEIEKRLRVEVAPTFWQHLSSIPVEDESSSVSRFQTAVSDLFASAKSLLPMVMKMDALARDSNFPVNYYGEKTYESIFWLLLRGTLHSQLPGSNFRAPIKAFYGRAFHVFHVRRDVGADNSMEQDEDEADENLKCEGCNKGLPDLCECNAIMSSFHEVNKKLLEMKLLERLTSDVVTSLVRERIAKHVSDTCNGSFTSSYLQPLSDWLDSVVMLWIRLIYSAESAGVVCTEDINATLLVFRQRLAHYLFETYTQARIDQLYNIIIEFPESQPAVEDLRECLERTDLRPTLTKSLKKVLETKLLHLGVNTTDIITAYIAAIRALRVLDSSGVLLEIVCEPVRKYLRTREDTVRSIVQNLIDDNTNDLAEELMKNEGLCLDDSYLADDLNDPEELEATWESWMPDPVDADPSKLSHPRKRSSDIISMLVNIYGSKELFVNEYRTLLSNRLLSQFTYDTEREIRNLELLKLRFGEMPLHQCEVMLRDISDSKRINSLLHSELEGCSTALKFKEWPVNSIIVSAQFWPQFKMESIELPNEVARGLFAYTKAFEAVKGNRTLVWKPHLGVANIDLEIGDKKINLTVSPIHAAIIYQFQIKTEWSAEELAHKIKVPASTLRRRITFWQTQGLIKETSPDNYQLIEEGPMRRMSGASSHLETGHDMDDEGESVTRTSKDQRAEELQVFWSFIVNMLINLDSLPLERIFQMLKMFAMQGPSSVECDIEELRSFLDDKVRQHELVFSGGQYKLPKLS